ncbi:MAG TPA: hypothetical protein VG897_06245 [Terriglobales bacterium]|nr:hypothetical protein [Terriglobales bacterium]
MLKRLIVVFVSLLGTALLAQDANPHLEPDQQSVKTPPVVSFTLNFPNFKPPFYNISVESSGKAEYKSTAEPNNVGDPYLVKFVVSDAARTRIFDAARELNFFQGNFEYTKNKVAFTGTKTLTFKDADKTSTTTYNWSDNPTVQELTSLFQGISETIELGRQLEEKYRYDKLGVDSILKAMEEEAKDKRLAELQAIQPILTRIAKDSSLMNISRRRAEFLLTKVPKQAAVTANGGRP